MKRSYLLAHIRSTGYHEDTQRFLRLLIENRITKRKANEAYIAGRNARLAGVKCTCPDCNNESDDPTTKRA